MTQGIGKIGWIDLTTNDAPGVRSFYEAVVGWSVEDTDMGEYADYTMLAPEDREAIAGICHARGSNAEMPGGWLIYITVADVEKSAAACVEEGGKLLLTPRGLAGGRFCVIEDPSGAIAALYQP